MSDGIHGLREDGYSSLLRLSGLWCGAGSDLQTWRFFQAYGLLEFRMNNLSDAEAAVVRRYLGTLTVLEFAVPRAGDNLDTDQARYGRAIATNCATARRLFDDWRRRLCGFFGVPPGPALADSGITLVV